MGKLGGFRYREIIAALKLCGFEFYRHAAGSHAQFATLLDSECFLENTLDFLSLKTLAKNTIYFIVLVELYRYLFRFLWHMTG